MDASAHVIPNEGSPPLGFAKKLERAADFARFLYVQRVSGFSISGEPEFEAECVPFFKDQLAKAETYLEFGAGGSSIIAARAGKRMVSVESDPFFMTAVRDKIGDLGLTSENQDFIHADIGITEAWGAPLIRTMTPARLSRWKRYMNAPWASLERLPGPYLVLVDGRFRVACALAAARFLRDKDGAILLDDYVGRAHYTIVERHCDVRERVGRMVLMKPRADIDAAALDTDIESYSADWR